MVHVTLFSMINLSYFYSCTFRSLCALPNMAVLFFCSFLISCFGGMLRRQFLNDFQVLPVDPSVTSVFTFYIGCISIMRSLYFKILSVFFFNTFLSPGISISISRQNSFFIISDYVVWFIVRDGSVILHCWFYTVVKLLSSLASADFNVCLCHCSFIILPIFLGAG